MMEVGGQKSDKDLVTSSDQISSPSCQPCSSDGEYIEAEGYCQTCGEYLCGTCYTCHRRLVACRSHVLLDKASMPTLTANNDSATKLSLCTVICPDHNDKVMEFYCSTHDTVQCGVCAVIKHTNCDVKYITELKEADNYKDSAEYNDTITRLQTLTIDTGKLIEDVQTNMTITEDMLNVKKEDIEAFGDEIIKTVPKQVDLLIQQVTKRKEENSTSKQRLIADLQSLQHTLEQSERKVVSLQAERSDLFAASKKAREQSFEFGNALKEYQSQNQQAEYTFRRNEDLHRFMSSNGQLGTLEQSFQYRNLPLSSLANMAPTVDFTSALVTKLPDINMKLNEDTRKPTIYGLVYLPPNRLLATDWYNCKIKVIDTTSNTIISSLSLSSNPHDITLLPRDREAAITMPNENRIQVISTPGQLSCLRSIPVGGNCYGICATSSSIIVSFSPPAMIQVMDLTWRVLTTIHTNDDGKQLFVYPYYVSIAEENGKEMILVSDWSTNAVTKLTMQGNIVSTYERNTWRYTYGLEAVGEKQVLVSNGWGQTVDVVEEDTDNVVTLLDNKTIGIYYPRALCYCPAQGRLYAASYYGGYPVWAFDINNKE